MMFSKTHAVHFTGDVVSLDGRLEVVDQLLTPSTQHGVLFNTNPVRSADGEHTAHKCAHFKLSDSPAELCHQRHSLGSKPAFSFRKICDNQGTWPSVKNATKNRPPCCAEKWDSMDRITP